jgi:hypothetical protein
MTRVTSSGSFGRPTGRPRQACRACRPCSRWLRCDRRRARPTATDRGRARPRCPGHRPARTPRNSEVHENASAPPARPCRRRRRTPAALNRRPSSKRRRSPMTARRHVRSQGVGEEERRPRVHGAHRVEARLGRLGGRNQLAETCVADQAVHIVGLSDRPSRVLRCGEVRVDEASPRSRRRPPGRGLHHGR